VRCDAITARFGSRSRRLESHFAARTVDDRRMQTLEHTLVPPTQILRTQHCLGRLACGCSARLAGLVLAVSSRVG
jgi:hypothetical protein